MSYKGKICTTGSSDAIRLDKDLFKQHPEFEQQVSVRADVIGHGTLLISIVGNKEAAVSNEADPIFSSFLSFIENDITQNFKTTVSPLDKKQISKAKALVKGIKTTEKDFD